ncbi:MAG: Asp-tRNA(Asn)/Glu-tRNA(Gln) amidotransferase subunit GatC [Cytophagales bacterium]|nr:Asp-tRNA(Asn)/Glu-tRNA(Gln) amidotransferase subunit GatC [Cytophagales bacterium]
MQVDKETLSKIAHLARLEFEERDEKEMIESLTEILSWVEQLEEVDTEGVEPLTTMSKEVNVLREDEASNRLDQQNALKNAPKKDSVYFRVPKVLD